MIYSSYFAGWNTDELYTWETIGFALVLVVPIVIFLLIITSPGWLLLLDARRGTKQTKRDINLSPEYKQAKRKKRRNQMLLGWFIIFLPFIYWQIDQDFRRVKDILTYPGTYYKINDDVARQFSQFGPKLELEPINTNKDFGKSLSDEYEECVNAKIRISSCHKFEHEVYGTVYLNEKDNSYKVGESSILLRTNKDAVKLRFTSSHMPRTDNERSMDMWNTISPVIDGLEIESKFSRAF